jgi:dsDNA-specific endonuclease/ATPase MutS2
VDDESGLTDGEILEIQLRRFEMALETALNGNVRKIVFIHGVGQGKLKYEISKVLNKKYPDLKYQDASFKEYGYGATMVLLH